MERAMSEIEFERVMEAVRMAIVLPVEDSLARSLVAAGPLKATNDNVGPPPWPIIPFPEGSCVS
jgi:hypothetical protein